MSGTPRALLDALDEVTALVSAPESASLKGRHYARVRSVFDDENMVGAGIAEKVIAGEGTGELGLVFYVRRKRRPDELTSTLLVPPVLADRNGRAVFTDVVEIGDIRPEYNAGQPPLQCGYSCGHQAVTAGTLGAFVRKNRKLHILSNSHVLANSGLAAVGDPILCPSTDDGGVHPRDVVASLSTFTPWTPGRAFLNDADAALAEVVKAQIADHSPEVYGAATPFKVAAPRRGMAVVKRGRTSGDTKSVVRDTDFRILVNYDGVGVVGFTGQVRCDNFTEGGDSGAVVVAKESGAIVGLHFAGSEHSSVFTPMRTVMKALSFTL